MSYRITRPLPGPQKVPLGHLELHFTGDVAIVEDLPSPMRAYLETQGYDVAAVPRPHLPAPDEGTDPDPDPDPDPDGV